MKYIFLNDGETFTNAEGCMLVTEHGDYIQAFNIIVNPDHSIALKERNVPESVRDELSAE